MVDELNAEAGETIAIEEFLQLADNRSPRPAWPGRLAMVISNARARVMCVQSCLNGESERRIYRTGLV